MYSLDLSAREHRMDGVASSPLTTDPAPSGAAGVTVVEPQVRRYRAVLTRTISLKTVIEFDAPETADRYALADELAAQVPLDAYETVEEGHAWVDNIEAIDAALVETTLDGVTGSDWI